jgi:hypothetical protein
MRNNNSNVEYLKVARDVLELLKTKHVIIEGHNSEARSSIIEYIRQAMATKYSIYEIPSNICDKESYLEAIRLVFPIESPLNIDARQMNYNQINDMQIDWIEFHSR